MTELAIYRELRESRADLIRAARAAGRTWEEISEVSGIGRAQLFRLVQKYPPTSGNRTD